MPTLPETTPDQDAQAAGQALSAGDLRQAMHRVSAALCGDPLRTEWLALLGEVVRRAPDAVQLALAEARAADFPGGPVLGWVLAARGQLADALQQVATAAANHPEVPFLAWAVDWVRRPGAAGTLPLDFVEGALVPALLRMLGDVPAPMPEHDARAGTVSAAEQLLAVLAETQPASALLLFARSFALRRLGRTDDAGYFAYQAYQKKPDWNASVGVALANRDAGRVEEALSWFRHALTFDPDDLSARLDIGDTLLGAERWDEAIAAYGEVLERAPDHPWAKPSVLYARYRKDERPEDKGALFLLAQRAERAWSLFTRIEPDQPFLNHLPPATEPDVRALRDVIVELAETPAQSGRPVDLPLDQPGAPSAALAFSLWCEARGVAVELRPRVDHVPTPDPRYPKAQVDFVLWTWEGDVARATGGPPEPDVAEAIARIARVPYHLELWDPLARELGARLGTAGLQHLLAVMVHPPALPHPDRDPFDWVRRVQIAAALAIGAIETAWEPSYRKRALYGLLVGPVDWTVEAAIVALAWLGRSEPDVRRDATQLFGWMEQQVPSEGEVSFAYPLACASLWMGGADGATEARLKAWKEQLEEQRRA